MITHLYFDNFRSLKEVNLPTRSLMYFCGPNGAGKTNLSEAVDFLSNAFRNGLPYAVAEKGGFFNMCFRKERRSRGGITFGLSGKGSSISDQPQYQFDPGLFEYSIDFSLRTRGESIRSDFYIATESYRFTFNLGTPLQSHLEIERIGNRYIVGFNSDLAQQPGMQWLKDQEELFEKIFKPDDRELLYLRGIRALLPLPELYDPQRIRVYRLSPRFASAAGAPSVSGELGKYGANLPSALDYLATHDPDSFIRLQRWVRDVIPSLEELKTDYTQTRQMGLFVQEKGFGSQWYAEELSDGTLMAIALFLAILDKRSSLVFIEEPENSLHPWILESFLQCCKEESDNKLVLISTQSPIVVAHATPENLFLVERTDGRTGVLSAIEREPTIHTVINEKLLDLGEYWLSGGLKAVPVPPQTSQEELFRDDKEEQ